MIELAPDLDIETVTEIFIRINSKGVVLSQADFVMSKIASNSDYNGNELRKAIDYFCHLAIAPDFFRHIIDNDKDFINTDFFQKIQWLKSENEDLYDPDYNDLIRVAFTTQFNRGRLSDLVSLLSGRNPDFLIEHHINSIEILENTNLEIIPTAYLLINGGKKTAVQKISKTKPIESNDFDLAYKTAKAGELLGKKLIYLEAGSGAKKQVPFEMLENIIL